MITELAAHERGGSHLPLVCLARLSGARGKKDLTPFAQPLRVTLRGRAPNLAAIRRQDSGSHVRGLLNSSQDHLPGETIISRLSGSFPLQPQPLFHSSNVTPTVLQRCKMYTANDTLERIHPRLMALIEHHKAACGCTMKAVKQVAKRVGASEFWVRRVTGRYGKVKIQAHQFFNVLKEHVRLTRAKRRAAKNARIFSAEKRSKAELNA